jgi:hypothetical protein
VQVTFELPLVHAPDWQEYELHLSVVWGVQEPLFSGLEQTPVEGLQVPTS